MFRNTLVTGFLIFILSGVCLSQTCGFGCLGLGGFFAGYSYQKYDAEGLNKFIAEYNKSENVISKMDEFGVTSGFRIGANILRTKYKDLLFSVKGYYQFQKENKRASELISENQSSRIFTLKTDYWGAGFDIGISVFEFLDVKLVDAQFTFLSADLNINLDPQPANYREGNYSNKKTGIGYSLSGGVIFKVIGDYISIETSAGYTQLKIKEMESDDNDPNSYYQGDGLTDFIHAGGFNAVVQLNVGIPIY